MAKTAGDSEGGSEPTASAPAAIPSSRNGVPAALASGVLLFLSQTFVLPGSEGSPLLPDLAGLLGFVCFVPLLVVVREAGPKRAYWTSFLAIWVGYYGLLWWMINPLWVFAKLPLPLAMGIVGLCVTAIAAALAAPFAISRFLAPRCGGPFWLLLPIGFTGIEHVRNIAILGGFPWANLGMSQATVPLFLQGAAIFGVYGLVFFLMFVNSALAEAWACVRSGQPGARVPLSLAGAFVVVVGGYGAARLASAPTDPETIKVAMLQGNIEQGIKNEEEQNANFILRRYHQLQADAVQAGADLVVWPEAALPWSVAVEDKSLVRSGVLPNRGRGRAAKEHIPPAGIIGATAYFYIDESGEPADDAAREALGFPPRDRASEGQAKERKKRRRAKDLRRYNTAFAVTEGLEIVGRFDKAHLVPFGEYVPWPVDGIIRQLVNIRSIPGDGQHTTTLSVRGRDVEVGATICYEGAFPEISRGLAQEGAELLFNVTNDAWYGLSSMSWQHLYMYGMRAAETGVPVARAANTGISGWFDSRGRLRAHTGVYETTFLLDDVPLAEGTTPYVRLGDWVSVPCLVVFLLLWLVHLLGPDWAARPRGLVERRIGTLGLGIAAVALVVHYGLREVVREGDETRTGLLFIGGLLVGIGALSGRPWGRGAQLWVGGLAAVFGAVALVVCAYFGWWYDAVLGVGWGSLGAVVWALAKRRRAEYSRAPGP